MHQPLMPVTPGWSERDPRHKDYTGRTRDPEDIRHATLFREPYVRVDLPDLGTIDAKAQRWTDSDVLIHWETLMGGASKAWVPAEWVTRIRHAESRWTSMYDKFKDGAYLGDE